MYEFKEVYTLDFTDVEQYLDVHAIIRRVFDWPEDYGCNWDAFWDCLTDMVGRPVHVEIIGLEVIEKNFDDYAKKLIDTFREFKHYDNDKYSHEIQIEIVSGNTRVSLR